MDLLWVVVVLISGSLDLLALAFLFSSTFQPNRSWHTSPCWWCQEPAITIIMMLLMMMPSFPSSNDDRWRVSFGSTIKGVMVGKVAQDVVKATSIWQRHPCFSAWITMHVPTNMDDNDNDADDNTVMAMTTHICILATMQASSQWWIFSQAAHMIAATMNGSSSPTHRCKQSLSLLSDLMLVKLEWHPVSNCMCTVDNKLWC